MLATNPRRLKTYHARALQASLVVASILLAASTSQVGACIHDQLEHKVSASSQQYGDSHPFELAERRRQRRHLEETGGDVSPLPQEAQQSYDRIIGDTVDTSSYRSIRITPYYDNESISQLPQEQRNILFKIVPDAIERFKNLLSVVPVQGNLMASRSCNMQWTTTPPVCKTFVKGEMCLEMPIPVSHFAPTRFCSTCLSPGCKTGACEMSQGSGVPDSDFVLYIRADKTSYCTDSVLAYAASCQKDQFDRPTFGMANFCPSQIKTDPYQYQSQLSTAMHEITHALGFSAQFFPLMRNEDGTPRTPREADGQPASVRNAKCPNGQTTSYYMPSSTSTVAFSNERDTSVARMVTPRVAAFVKAHFACDGLTGAELENQDDGCLGSHWEERIFEPEYMTPISSFRNVLSDLTLAFFEDSGWYKANRTMAERLHFGANKGCDFAKNKCIDKETGTSVAPDHFCTSNTAESCTVDASARSVCSILSGQSNIPEAFQYFSDPTRGGNNEYADYCPINTGFKGGDCANTDNLVMPTGTKINILGETYCPTCKCTATTLRSSDSSKWIVNARRQTGCYAMRCPTNATVELLVPVVGSATDEKIAALCTRAGEKVSVKGYSGDLTCPDPVVVCQRSCPGACSGNGVCNFGTAQCTCSPGFTGDDCATNSTTTPAATKTSVLRTTNHGTSSTTSLLSVGVVLVATVAPMLARRNE